MRPSVLLVQQPLWWPTRCKPRSHTIREPKGKRCNQHVVLGGILRLNMEAPLLTHMANNKHTRKGPARSYQSLMNRRNSLSEQIQEPSSLVCSTQRPAMRMPVCMESHSHKPDTKAVFLPYCCPPVTQPLAVRESSVSDPPSGYESFTISGSCIAMKWTKSNPSLGPVTLMPPHHTQIIPSSIYVLVAS